MYAWIHNQTRRQLTYRHLPELAGAIVIAEIFYKFHSFTLEALAFLATWYGLDFVVEKIVRRFPGWRDDALEGVGR